MTILPGSGAAPVCGSARPTLCFRSRMVVLALVAMALALVPSVCVATRPYTTSDGGVVELAATGRDLMQADDDMGGTTRTYYISAEEVMWDYTGGNPNTCAGRDFNDDENVWVGNGLGAIYKKARFIQYTDETFTEVIPSAPHEGILGPTIFMEAGDELVIEFRNTLPFFANIQVNGLRAEGAQLSMVPPGNSTTYRFMAGPDSEPGPADGVSTVWTYASTMDLAGHANLGLLGAIIVTKKGEANPDGRAKDVDHDRVLAMQVLNENVSPFLEDNMAGRTIEDLGMTEEEFEESNLMHGMNGLVFCNLFGLEFNVGERIRWHTLSVGNEVDMHTNHWHGHTLLSGDGRHRMDTVQLLPATTSSMDMFVDRPGTWLIHCHVNDHLAAGMIALYTVNGEGEPFETTGQQRVYYFQAETVEWDYMPNGDQCPDLPEYSKGIEAPQTFTKARYFQYADPEFTVPVPRAEEDMHLGILGPTIRGEVGDRIIVHFRNKDVPFPISLHAHGVSYNKDSEGAPYNDGTSGPDKRDDFVEAGQEWTYTWDAAEASSPGSGDGSSIMWMYHSHTDEITNTYAGLMGAIIITAKGMADEEGRPTDVDRELVVLYQVFDEDWSPYSVVNTDQELRFLSAVNGYMFCNLEGMTMTQGETTRMYVFGLGTEIDVHSPHAMATVMRGNIGGIEAFGLLPGGMHSLDLHPSRAGNFRFDDRNDALVRMGGRAEMVVLASAEEETGETSSNGDDAPIRRYWIAADEVEWDYAPFGNACLGQPFTEETGGVFANPSKYTKALYREYTNGSFSEIIPVNPVAGMVGPLLTCEEGDTLHISFRNNLPFAANLHPGGFDPIGDAVDSVSPGRTAQLFFRCPNAVEAELAETRGEDPVISFTYISTIDPVVHTNTGLLGPVLVAKKGTLDTVMQKPTIPMLFSVQDENESYYFVKNLLPIVMPEEASEVADDGEISEAARAALDNLDPEGNLMHGINGYIFCNGPPLTCNPDDELRLILMGFGSETGIHGPRISDHALQYHGRRATAPAIYPSTSVVADLTCYVEGFYAVWCDVHDHVDAGMSSLFIIGNPGAFVAEDFETTA